MNQSKLDLDLFWFWFIIPKGILSHFEIIVSRSSLLWGGISKVEEEECNLDGLCVDFLLEVTIVLSKTECYLKCHENPQCEWYTYNYDHDGTCHLNKGCNSVVLLNQGFVRSHQNCEVLKCNLQRHTYNFS